MAKQRLNPKLWLLHGFYYCKVGMLYILVYFGLFTTLPIILPFPTMVSVWCHSFNACHSSLIYLYLLMYLLSYVISAKFVSCHVKSWVAQRQSYFLTGNRWVYTAQGEWGDGWSHVYKTMCVCRGWACHRHIAVSGSHFNVKVLGSAVLINSH